MIVRLHKYSLGRVNYKQTVHWQRGLVRVQNKRQEFLWAHPQFEQEY